jgi:hypothetical protein
MLSELLADLGFAFDLEANALRGQVVRREAEISRQWPTWTGPA